jgi:hypothetical protein
MQCDSLPRLNADFFISSKALQENLVASAGNLVDTLTESQGWLARSDRAPARLHPQGSGDRLLDDRQNDIK